MSQCKVYYDPKRTVIFGSVGKLLYPLKIVKGSGRVVVRSKHIHSAQTCMRRFPRNPYTITNINDVWEMDLANLRSVSKYDRYKHLLNAMEIFSRYAWSVHVNDKTATSNAAASIFLFQNRKPINIQSGKCTKFLIHLSNST